MYTGGEHIMKVFFTTSGILLALSVALLLGSRTVQAEVFTGCVTPGGTVIHLRLGETPKEPCSHKQKLIHLNNDKHNEHTLYHHEATCTALENAGALEADLIAMGCPITPTIPPASYKLVQPPSSFYETAPHEYCGLKVEQRPQWGTGWHIVVYGSDDYSWDEADDPPVHSNNGGGYLAYTTQVYSGDESASPQGDCQAICNDDDKCVAARVTNRPDHAFEDCDVFHHSDTVGVPYNIFCGIFPSGENTIGSCQTSQRGSNTWYVKCEVTP